MKGPGRMLQLILESIFQKPSTINYPKDKSGKIKDFRGAISFDASKCIGCKLCMKDCPSNAIIIKQIGEKQFEADIDLAKCVYCGQCADSCPKKAIGITDEFELAALDKNKLKVVLHVEAKEPPPKETPESL
jgi:formate hydrogenlyase subunit 6/NADH:ubiquinone oxidoreductase subunit I